MTPIKLATELIPVFNYVFLFFRDLNKNDNFQYFFVFLMGPWPIPNIAGFVIFSKYFSMKDPDPAYIPNGYPTQTYNIKCGSEPPEKY